MSVIASREESRHFSSLVEYSEIEENSYNLSISTYVEVEDTREKIGIVKLNAEIEEIVAPGSRFCGMRFRKSSWKLR